MIGNNSGTFSRQLSHERLLMDANRLFNISWLIQRLTDELAKTFGECGTNHVQLFHTFRSKPDNWFAWGMLQAHGKSIYELTDLQSLFPDRAQLTENLREERQRRIEEFSQMQISKRWDTLRDDDRTWRDFARMMYGLKETTPEMAERAFRLLDEIFMMTLVILGDEVPYFQNSPTTAPLLVGTLQDEESTPDLQSIDVRATLKLFLRGPWFDSCNTNKELYTPEWRDHFIAELIDSKYGEAIIHDCSDNYRSKLQIVKGALVGCLGMSGVLKAKSYLDIARKILYPDESSLPDDKQSKDNRLTKCKTFSKYIGDHKKQKYYYWVKEYVETHQQKAVKA